MARSSGKACKYARREGTDLFLKSKGLKTKKSDKKPGQHGAKTSRLSNYGIQLREKQKIKRIYGMTERQFHNYYVKAARKKGATGVTLLEMLEARLDNIVFRAGFAATRPEARQLVNHGAIMVDGRKVDIPSFQVSAGAIISLSEKGRLQKRVDGALAIYNEKPAPEWITTNTSEKTATFKRLPQRDELPAEYNENFIVELYSK
ncbi:MAG TPA: 30S ribosomal protein S4 [Gammaproteobacteria bacterium]|nr:30S ribosomal protein S4 [Gammaproteobacteria bacterium]